MIPKCLNDAITQETNLIVPNNIEIFNMIFLPLEILRHYNKTFFQTYPNKLC